MSIFDLFKKIENKSEAGSGPVSHIVCCLGNPGAKYEKTRHNVGFLAADVMARSKNVKINRLRFHAVTAEAEEAGKRLLILKPQTFMNDSGIAAREALDFYKLPPERLIAVCDDLELPCGRLRVRSKGSSGGHNGLKSIIYHLNSESFPRVKIGIGRPAHPEHKVIDWVLGAFGEGEGEAVSKAVECAAAAALEIIKSSPEAAAGMYNGKDFSKDA